MRIFLALLGIGGFVVAAIIWADARAIPQQIVALIFAVIGMLGVCAAAIVDAIVSSSARQIEAISEGNAIARLDRKERKAGAPEVA